MDPYLAKLIKPASPTKVDEEPPKEVLRRYTVGDRTLWVVRGVLSADDWHVLSAGMLAIRVQQELRSRIGRTVPPTRRAPYDSQPEEVERSSTACTRTEVVECWKRAQRHLCTAQQNETVAV